MHSKTISCVLEKGVRQGETLSLKLLMVSLVILSKAELRPENIKIDGEHIYNLRFIDDIVLTVDNVGKIRGMTKELNNTCKAVGAINCKKTKITTINKVRYSD